MAKTLDQNGTKSGLRCQNADSPSVAEQAARALIEQSCGRPLSDGEWAKQRRRLLEFVLTLKRWERERQAQTEVSRQAEEEVCKTVD